MRMRDVLYKIVVVGLLFFFGLALFYHLGRFSFWHDEAETALLAKSILKFGLPWSQWDAIWITHFHGQEARADYLWTHTPWLPFYLTALSFKLFGFQEWAGRLPFAIAGFLSAIILFLAVKQLKNKTMALLTLFFYVTNVTVIIYSRQCKYYPVYLLGFSLVMFGFFRWQEKRKGLLWGLLGFLICFHCNYLSAGLALLALGCYTRGDFFIKIVLGVFIFFAPFLLLSSFGNRVSVSSEWPSALLYLTKLGAHVYYWNRQIFPLLLGFFFFWKRPPFFKWMGITILVSWGLLPLLSQDVLRYNLHLIPIFSLLLGFVTATLWEHKKIGGGIFFVLIFATNILQGLPDAIHEKSYQKLLKTEDWVALKNYYFKEYQDPLTILPGLLKSHSQKNEHVYLNHNQLPWEWYSDIPLAYLGDPKKTPPKEPPLQKEWTDPKYIDWWIGPDLVKLGKGPYLSQEEVIKIWKEEGYTYEEMDSGISMLNWGLNSPIRYKHFLDRFSEVPKPSESIKLLHRIK